MYGKIFKEIFDSSLVGECEGQALFIFMSMIVLADAEGFVRVDPLTLYRRMGLPDEDPGNARFDNFLKAIEVLEAPDDSSNLMDQEGRRIIPLSTLTDGKENRGWWIVQYEHYRKKANMYESRLKTKQRVQRFRDKNKDCNEPVTPCNALLTVETDKKKEKDKKKDKKKKRIPPNPPQGGTAFGPSSLPASGGPSSASGGPPAFGPCAWKPTCDWGCGDEIEHAFRGWLWPRYWRRRSHPEEYGPTLALVRKLGATNDDMAVWSYPLEWQPRRRGWTKQTGSRAMTLAKWITRREYEDKDNEPVRGDMDWLPSEDDVD